ncbi:flavodoxin-dependent (E)-4-hydroxy-3-methylbut-2-enyl-diphosphate synthase [bacterium endosymbiont of Pedicinus badii]|uniref:flavodoxin-dependent (E)-4-hydroxy-3-methylbut-2-enyl-diphosphate synthase n=1 Tax=bacterium endosymbiont of Pedicinus badii TaxID=1719126 RepID=UPI0009BBAC89|nr:flavodoxin-dependent (E)-4-hydroxy-3-methylbut-2-enyl-diphosphate synthase [bacterium endosymbiont of Pedicinus badii]OQM34487.1 4-hydroxy-3-methylbut-2-en-1-yl diphosphate synthase [bacterium endosymbiont of Pedicinus badii]
MKKINKIFRKKTKRIYIRKVPIGNNAVISVQSMTTTKTTEIKKTVKQIMSLKNAGADIVRISVPDKKSAEAFKIIRNKTNIPLVADIHFDYRIAIESIKNGADCIRINPSNIGSIKRIQSILEYAKDYNVPIRIGINSGSIEKKIIKKYKYPNAKAMLESAMNCINIFEKMNFQNFKLSVKSSNVLDTIQCYKLLSCHTDHPMHLGITESGNLQNGTIKSSIGIGSLLLQGIGDTIRVSLSENPIEEVKVGLKILNALEIRKYGVNIISCPTCARKEFDVIKIANSLEKKLSNISEPIDVAIMGCSVNGPGESKISQVGVSGLKNKSALYINGIRKKKIKNSLILKELKKNIQKIIEIKNKYRKKNEK